ncbi:MAG TPA: lipoyl(octanoyl) transferase [Balneolaceae bacterium]|nr:lipoyl(octanoyl) transferase [Balneolaceae bacterium]|tara:strand:- start:18958 stop:19686 length:729 start_codon:yes stop_codon:yes gene_type:complete
MEDVKTIELYDLGRKEYRATWELQQKIQSRIIAEKRAEQEGALKSGRKKDVLLLVEHPHVYTLGKSGVEENMLRSMAELKDLHADYVKIDRGGDITYHGPGQIVGYPIMDLDRHFTDIHKYLRYLEEVMIRLLQEYGIDGGRLEGLTGAWVNESKICAMGIRCSRWVTMHGFALNVNTNLDYFSNIVPCGIDDKKVTSLEELLGHPVELNEVKEKIVKYFAEVFELQVESKGGQAELEEIFL